VDYNPSGSGDLDVLLSTNGNAVARDPGTEQLTLAPGTYYVELGSDHSAGISTTGITAAHLAWSAAFAATITAEGCNFPGGTVRRGAGKADVSSWDGTAGNWIPLSSAVNQDVVGTGNTATGNTITAGGSNAGGCMYRLANVADRRVRLKLVVTVAGTCRINRRVKQAA